MSRVSPKQLQNHKPSLGFLALKNFCVDPFLSECLNCVLKFLLLFGSNRNKSLSYLVLVKIDRFTIRSVAAFTAFDVPVVRPKDWMV